MPSSTSSSAVVALSTPAALYLKLSQLGFSMSQALRLRKLADMMHVSPHYSALRARVSCCESSLRRATSLFCAGNDQPVPASNLATGHILWPLGPVVGHEDTGPGGRFDEGEGGRLRHRVLPADDALPPSPQSLEAMLADFRSRLWFTYRRDFPALGRCSKANQGFAECSSSLPANAWCC